MNCGRPWILYIHTVTIANENPVEAAYVTCRRRDEAERGSSLWTCRALVPGVFVTGFAELISGSDGRHRPKADLFVTVRVDVHHDLGPDVRDSPYRCRGHSKTLVEADDVHCQSNLHGISRSQLFPDGNVRRQLGQEGFQYRCCLAVDAATFNNERAVRVDNTTLGGLARTMSARRFDSQIKGNVVRFEIHPVHGQYCRDLINRPANLHQDVRRLIHTS